MWEKRGVRHMGEMGGWRNQVGKGVCDIWEKWLVWVEKESLPSPFAQLAGVEAIRQPWASATQHSEGGEQLDPKKNKIKM